MFQASKWMRTLRAKTNYRDAVFEVSSHKNTLLQQGGSLVWLRVQVKTDVGTEWEYLVMDKATALAIGERLRHAAFGLPD